MRSTAATIEAMGVRVLLAGGEIFQAGQRARRLLGTAGADTGPDADPLPRIVALTAHLRVLAAAGDLELARGQPADTCRAGTRRHECRFARCARG